jgi:dihydroorotase
MDTVICGGWVVDPSQGVDQQLDVLIQNGRIAALAEKIATGDRHVIDAAGMTVLPGFIDMHTHLREPGGEAKETVLTACRAAAAGGYTGITALPNTTPVMDQGQTIEDVLTLAKRAALVHVWPVGAATKGSAGLEPAALEAMHRAGAVAFTDDGHGVQSAGLTKKIMRLCQELDTLFMEHCEENTLAGKGQIHDGMMARKLGLPGLSASSETVMLARDIILAKETGCRLHVMHISCREAVEMIRRAKRDGVRVTAEVTPHHLLLTEESLEGYNTDAKMKPPLRSLSDLDALRLGLADGTIDAIATDHAPHTREEKAREFVAAPFGIVGLETAFSLLFTHLVQSSLLTLSQLVDKMAVRPAAILGVPHGTLQVGTTADVVLADTNIKHVIDRNRFHSKGKNTPFDGWPVAAVPALTMVGGRIIMRNGFIES